MTIGCELDRPPSTASGIGCEKQCSLRNFLRDAVALQRIELSDFAFRAALAGALEYRPGHAAFNEARTHRVDAHAGSRQLICHRLHHADDAGLAGAIRNAAGTRAQTGNRGGADDGPALLLDHLHRCVLGQEESTDQIDVQHLAPALGCLLEERDQTAADPGVRIAHIQAAEFFERHGDCARDILFRRRVCDHGDGTASRRADRFGSGMHLSRSVQCQHCSAVRGEQYRACPSYAACRSGDDGGLAS
jgi:hypothetical protein